MNTGMCCCVLLVLLCVNFLIGEENLPFYWKEDGCVFGFRFDNQTVQTTTTYYFPLDECVYTPSPGDSLEYVKCSLVSPEFYGSDKAPVSLSLGCGSDCNGCGYRSPDDIEFPESWKESNKKAEEPFSNNFDWVDGNYFIYYKMIGKYFPLNSGNDLMEWEFALRYYTDGQCNTEKVAVEIVGSGDEYFNNEVRCPLVDHTSLGKRYLDSPIMRHLPNDYSTSLRFSHTLLDCYKHNSTIYGTYMTYDLGEQCMRLETSSRNSHSSLYFSVFLPWDYNCGSAKFHEKNACYENGYCLSDGECKCTGMPYYDGRCYMLLIQFVIMIASSVTIVVVCCCCCVCCTPPVVIFIFIVLFVVFFVSVGVILGVFVASVLLGIIFVVLVIFGCCVLCCGSSATGAGLFVVRKGLKRYERETELRNIRRNTGKYVTWDSLDGDDDDDDGTEKAKFEINQSLFIIDAEKVKLTKLIGAGGGGGSIYKAEWNDSIVAVKIFKTKQMGDDHDFQEFEREIKIMSSISHPNILRFYGCLLKPPRVGIVMEFCSNGDLQYYMKINEGELSFDEKIDLLFGVCRGISYLHRRNIIHRDLKMGNVLVDAMKVPKLIDFGLSRVVNERAKGNLTKQIGTAGYMAPEITLGKESYDNKVDVFSFAIMFFIVLTEEFHPYGKAAMGNIEVRVATDSNFRPKIPEGKEEMVPDWCHKMMVQCWSEKSDDRLSIDEIIKQIEENKKETQQQQTQQTKNEGWKQ